MPRPTVTDRLDELRASYDLDERFVPRMVRLLDLVAAEPTSITTVRDPAEGVDVHVADSLVGLEVVALREASTIADLGSGAGFPGLALAAALPRAGVRLVESVGKKCAFLRRAAEELELGAVEVVEARAEAWPAGLGVHDVVTARALAPLTALVEYAAPLLREGGRLLAWKGQPDAAEEADGRAASEALGMLPGEVVPVRPFPRAGSRHLYLYSKVSQTPRGYPRRPGSARKRPITASSGA